MKLYRAKAHIYTATGSLFSPGDAVLLSDEDAKRMIAEGTAEEMVSAAPVKALAPEPIADTILPPPPEPKLSQEPKSSKR